MIHTEICTEIEGAKLSLQCRQFYLHRPFKELNLSQQVFPFKLGIYSKAVIEEELNPKTSRIGKNSILDKGHGIEGETIYGFSTKLIHSPVIKHATAHRESFVNIRDYGYAHLQIGLRKLLQKKN